MAGKKGIIKFAIEIEGDKAAQEYQKLEKQLKQLQKEQTTFAEGSEEYKKSAKDIEALNKGLKALNPTYEQLTKTKSALEMQLKRLTPRTEEFIKKQEEVAEITAKWKKLKDEVKNLETAQSKAEQSTSKMGKVMSTLKGLNPFGAMLGPLGILLGLLGTLFAAFSKSKRGAELLTKAQGALQGVMSVLVGLVNNLMDVLIDVWENPVDSLKNLGKLIVENIINRFKGAIEMTGALGKALGELVTGDFKAAKEAAKEAGTAYTQMMTGLDGEQQAAFGAKVRETANEVVNQANAFSALAMAQRNAGANMGKLAIELQQLVNEEERLNAIADAATLSFKDREEAAEKARVVSEKRAKKEIELAKAQLGLLSQEINLRRANGEDVNDLLTAQADARAAVLAAEGNLQNTMFTNEEVRRQLVQDRLEKDLDILIDGYDFRKTILERQFNDDKTTFEKRKELQTDIETLGKDSFNRQIGVIEQFAKQKVNVEELLKSAEDGTLQNKVRNLGLSEIVEGRLFEIVKERSIAIQDFADLEATLAKEKADREKEAADNAKLDKETLIQSETDALQRLQELALASATDNNAQKLDIELEYLKKQKELREKYGQDTIDLDQQIALKEIEIAKDKQAREIELEISTQENKKAITAAVQQAATDSLDFFIGLLSKDEEARKKNAKMIKRFEKAKVMVNMYREISEIWKGAMQLGSIAGPIIGGIQTGIALGRGYLAVRTIEAQEFAKGGLVQGANIATQPNGDNVLATVKTGEVVLTVPQQIALGGAPVFRQIGVPGFAEGGVVGASSNTVNINPGQTVASALGSSNALVEAFESFTSEVRNWQTNVNAFLVYDEFESKKASIDGARSGASW